MLGRFATLALSALVASASATPFNTRPVKSSNTRKVSFMSKLVSNARPLRRLDEEEEIDLTGYSVKYEKCQFVKSYDDEMAENEEAGTVLATNRFVIFRLCPSSSCSYNYGEYLIDMETYLQSAIEFYQEEQENMCKYCEEVCAVDEEDENGRRKLRRLDELRVDCDTCVDECEEDENMEDNGYVEAANFVECQEIGEDDDDGDDTRYFAGAMCADNGQKIKIGVFTDEWCSQYDTSGRTVDQYVGATLVNKVLKKVYNSSATISCIEDDWEVPEDDDGNNNKNDEEEEVRENEMCMNLYEAAAKCESKHGFQDGYADYEGYENQLAQEELVCDFISTLSAGAYDETGDIVLKSKNAKIATGGTTGGQKFALTVFILGTVGLTVYAAQLHSQLTSGGATGTNEGGALA